MVRALNAPKSKNLSKVLSSTKSRQAEKEKKRKIENKAEKSRNNGMLLILAARVWERRRAPTVIATANQGSERSRLSSGKKGNPASRRLRRFPAPLPWLLE